jgi:hypothetical protein
LILVDIVVVRLQVLLEVADRILLTPQQEIYLVVYELKLTSHLLIDVVDLVHRTDCSMHSLEICEIFVEGCLQFALLLFGKNWPLLCLYCFLEEVFLAGVGDQQSCSFLQSLLSLQAIEDDQGAFL